MSLVGVDEAGCGALMGPLVAAAVWLPDEWTDVRLTDSKKMSAKKRDAVAARLRADATVGIGVGRVEVAELNDRPFGWARREVFQRALRALEGTHPVGTWRRVLVDGNDAFFDGFGDVAHECVVQGDRLHACISAASVIAKTERDADVARVCAAQPEVAVRYGWARNMGYPAPAHLEGLRVHGVSPEHRLSFGPCARSVA